MKHVNNMSETPRCSDVCAIEERNPAYPWTMNGKDFGGCYVPDLDLDVFSRAVDAYLMILGADGHAKATRIPLSALLRQERRLERIPNELDALEADGAHLCRFRNRSR